MGDCEKNRSDQFSNLDVSNEDMERRAFCPPFLQLRLQRGHRRAKIDMERCSINYQCWDRLHASSFSVSNPVLLFAKMNKFNIVTVRVQGICDLTLGVDTYRTASMIKGSACFHKSLQ